MYYINETLRVPPMHGFLAKEVVNGYVPLGKNEKVENKKLNS